MVEVNVNGCFCRGNPFVHGNFHSCFLLWVHGVRILILLHRNLCTGSSPVAITNQDDILEMLCSVT